MERAHRTVIEWGQWARSDKAATKPVRCNSAASQPCKFSLLI